MRTENATAMAIEVPWSDGGWQRVVVYGLGLSGRAAVRLLRARGVAVIAADDRPADELPAGVLEPLIADPEITLLLGPEAAAGPALEALLAAADGVVKSPGIPADRPLLAAARRHRLPVIGEVELAFACLDPKRDVVLAVTGSNGKSTTTAMTAALLVAAGRRAVACGNIGAPLADQVPPPGAGDTEPRVLVVELSSFQLEDVVHFRPRAAALLNLSPDHIDRHGDLERYRAAKAAIFRNQRAGDLAVLNADDPQVAGLAVAGRRRFFSRRRPIGDGCYLEGDRVVEVTPDGGRQELFRPADVAVEGLHNLENAMAAALLARSQAVPAAAIARGLRRFDGLPHRLQRVAERDGVIWYDDSKGTNLGATEASLEGFADGTVHLILGGRAKGTDFAPLVPLVARKAKAVYLIGEAAAAIDRALEAGAPQLQRIAAGTLERAVVEAAARARRGEVVLLSPACASFDQFADFVDRGRTFQRLVAALDEAAAKGGRDGS
ncbi:MAG: UDP-N-acetylmuramoyl-L-alanine--D-glutamate ligase [Acidobacteria bacterium]|nr:MAG: UDP-N-acetylmuramoyl-L-alanine--D-glutamate ligase [Acidobacteriota bacterium]